MSEQFKILDNLPPYGSLPNQFSASGQGMHSEGFVVEFTPTTNESWIGNFQPGLTTFNAVLNHPNNRNIIVIAGGEAYIVDPLSKELIQIFGGFIIDALLIKEKSLLVFNDNFSLSAFNETGLLWKTRRLSIDGIQNLKYDHNLILGEGLALNDKWFLFQIDINSGKVVNENELQKQEFLKGL